MNAIKSIGRDIAYAFGQAQHSFCRWIFEWMIKPNTTIEFKRLHGGQEVKAQIRMFGWMVGEDTILRKAPPAGQERKAGP